MKNGVLKLVVPDDESIYLSRGDFKYFVVNCLLLYCVMLINGQFSGNFKRLLNT